MRRGFRCPNCGQEFVCKTCGRPYKSAEEAARLVREDGTHPLCGACKENFSMAVGAAMKKLRKRRR